MSGRWPRFRRFPSLAVVPSWRCLLSRPRRSWPRKDRVQSPNDCHCYHHRIHGHPMTEPSWKSNFPKVQRIAMLSEIGVMWQKITVRFCELTKEEEPEESDNDGFHSLISDLCINLTELRQVSCFSGPHRRSSKTDKDSSLWNGSSCYIKDLCAKVHKTYWHKGVESWIELCTDVRCITHLEEPRIW